MIQMLGNSYSLAAIAKTSVFSVNVPADEKWLIMCIRHRSRFTGKQYVNLKINRETRYSLVSTTFDSCTQIQDEIMGGTNIELEINKIDATLDRIAALIMFDRQKL